MSNEILQGNVKIAEFMGGRLHKTGGHSYCQHVPILDGKQFGLFHVTDLQYHSSWDWLMPVWNKLTSILREVMPTDRYLHQLKRFENFIHCADISGCFEIIVENIDWYTLNVTPS